MVNMNREITRFAARGVYLEFDNTTMSPTSQCATDVQNDPFGVEYCKVISHANRSLANQLNMNYLNETGNASIIVTYYDIAPEATFDCPGDSGCLNTDCSTFIDPSHANYVAGENLATVEYPILSVAHEPGLDANPNKPAYYDTDFNIANTTALTKYHYHRGGPFFSRIDPQAKVAELRGQINQLNCQLVQKKLPPTGDNVVIIETSYQQEQLTGLPIFSVFVPDPIPLYTHTAMRLTTDLRDTGEDDQACNLVPFIIPGGAFGPGAAPGDIIPMEFDNGTAPGHFGMLTWNPGDPSQQELERNLTDTSRVADFYDEPDVSGNPTGDDILNIGDFIGVSTGVFGNSIDSQLNALTTSGLLYFPVWDDSACTAGAGNQRNCPSTEMSGTGSNARFKVRSFLIATLDSYSTTGGWKGVRLKFHGFSNTTCECDPLEDGINCDY
jgi:hypothetical protein